MSVRLFACINTYFKGQVRVQFLLEANENISRVLNLFKIDQHIEHLNRSKEPFPVNDDINKRKISFTNESDIN